MFFGFLLVSFYFQQFNTWLFESGDLSQNRFAMLGRAQWWERMKHLGCQWLCLWDAGHAGHRCVGKMTQPFLCRPMQSLQAPGVRYCSNPGTFLTFGDHLDHIYHFPSTTNPEGTGFWFSQAWTQVLASPQYTLGASGQVPLVSGSSYTKWGHQPLPSLTVGRIKGDNAQNKHSACLAHSVSSHANGLPPNIYSLLLPYPNIC